VARYGRIGRLTALVRSYAAQDGIQLYGDADWAEAYGRHMPTPVGDFHLHLNWRWGNYYWNITTRRNKNICGTSRCRPVHIEINWRRADQACVCVACGLIYGVHPLDPNALLDQDGRPWLHRLCDGSLVKL